MESTINTAINTVKSVDFKYKSDAKYECCPDIKCNKFTLLMFLVAHYKQIPDALFKIKAVLNNSKTKINAQNKLGWTALMIASRNSSTRCDNEIVELLLEYGANPDKQNVDGDTALILACQYSQTDSSIKTVDLLLNYDANVNITDNNGWSPLITTVNFNDTTSDINVINLLMKYKADINAITNKKSSSITIATRRINNNITAIKKLLEYKPNLNIKSPKGWTCLMLAINHAKTDEAIDIIQELLNHGADPNVCTNSGKSCLMIAFDNDENTKIMKLLINAGANINHLYRDNDECDYIFKLYKEINFDYNLKLKFDYDAIIKHEYNGHTVLMRAVLDADDDNCETVKMLLSNGVDPNFSNNNGITALMLAIMKRKISLNVIQLLLKHDKINSNCFDKYGNTPLSIAMSLYPKKCNLGVMETLLKFGANPNNKDYVTGFVSDTLTSNISEKYIIWIAYSHYKSFGTIDSIKLLLRYNVDINVKNKYGNTILMQSVNDSIQDSNLELVSMLIDHDPEFIVANDKNESVLHLAIKNNNIKTLKLFLEKGVCINTYNNNGMTCLVYYLSIIKNAFDLNIIKLLLEHEIDLNIGYGDNNDTVLMLVCSLITSEKDLDIVDLLIDHGANVNCQDANGNTPLIILIDTLIHFEKVVENNYLQDKNNQYVTGYLTNTFIDDSDNLIDNNNNNDYNKIINTIHQTIKLLLEKGADPNIKNSNNESAIFKIMDSLQDFGIKKYIELFCKYGLNINITNENNHTLLHEIFYFDEINLTKFVCDTGIDVNIKNSVGETALFHAIKFSLYSTDIIELLNYGADLNVINNSGVSVLMEIFNSYLDDPQDDSHVEIIKLLIEKGANANHSNDKTCILEKAIMLNNDSSPIIVELLLKNGADPNLIYNNQTVLRYLMDQKDLIHKENVVKLLFKYGMNPDICDEEGDSIMMTAIKMQEKMDIIHIFLDYKVNPNIINKKGFTALTLAICTVFKYEVYYYDLLVKVLIDYGANPNIQNSFGETSLMILFGIIKSLNITSTNTNKDNISKILFNTNGITSALLKRSNYKLLNNLGKTVYSYVPDDMILKFMEAVESSVIDKNARNNLHQSIINFNTQIVMKPESIRTRAVAIQWYADREFSFEEIRDHDKKLIDYFGIYDIESIRFKIQDSLKHMN
ncbi:putative ankyrin repeat protein [Megavirus lba]|uniref:Putative ankyrin repeat protein n=1 Tax=Megavirus lba TaxID=1235314 RepID=L7Y4P7_9VIRU|nr:putative ankyrin repeat protein [Megavirus lba]